MPKSAVALLMALFLLAGCTPRTPEARFALQGEAASPQGGFFVRRYVDIRPAGTGERQLWIREKTGESYFLFRYFRIAQLTISPDEEFLVVNDRRSGDDAGIVLYRRDGRGRFAEAGGNLDKRVWGQFYRDVHADAGFPGFDHHFLWCPRWIDDASFTVRLSGYGSRGLVERWAYSYDVKTGALAPDPGNDLKDVEFREAP